MDFTPSPRVDAVRRVAREVLEREVLPLEPALRRDGFAALLPRLQRARERARASGLWAPSVPERYGGAGLGLEELAHLSEELGKSPVGHWVFNCQAPDAGNMEILALHGTDEQKERWLLPLVRGAVRSCFTKYHHRQTRNPAFKNLWIPVNYLDWRCRAIIRRSEGRSPHRPASLESSP